MDDRGAGSVPAVEPMALPPNQLHRFYRGGERIAALRGIPSTDDHAPEDWVGAVNAAFGTDEDGLAQLEDGTLVRDAVAADPAGFLGPEHLAGHGSGPGLLVKLLDAGQRLPVHFHPGRRFAAEHLGSRYGKTEAWLIVEAEPGAQVHVGFREEVRAQTVAEWVRDQDAAPMLDAMNPLPVSAGDSVFVPAGTPHAIGEGILMVELQEPTDLSVLLEWASLGAVEESDAHLGLGWDRALGALDRSAWDERRLAALLGPPLPAAASPFFRAEWLRGEAELDPGYCILVVLDGEGALGDRPVVRGDTLLVPHAAGALRLTGGAELIRCRPPAPPPPRA